MRVVFMGTPEFAAASLDKLLEEGFEVVGVFTQPDKPKGRKQELSPPPVKELALSRGIPVYQPSTLRDGSALETVKALAPDVLAVVAYGKLLPQEMLALPRYGAINVHGSLLPKYRGAAPIQWAVLSGDERTGVTTMYLAAEMDSGDIIYTAETAIGERETSGELSERLMVMGAQLLVKTLRDVEAGTAPRRAQDPSQASYVSMLDKALSPINWAQPARRVLNWIYGLQPWPVATLQLGGESCKVFAAYATGRKTHRSPGQLVSAGGEGIEVACFGGETVMITEIQAPGKKRMSAADYLRGHAIRIEE